MHNILRPRKLDFYIEDSIVNITTLKKAEDQKIMKLYPISNLISTPGSTGSPPLMFPQPMLPQRMLQRQNFQQAASAAEINKVKGLVAVLENSVEPKYWDLNGGPGKMDYYPRTKSLIVIASQEVHYMLIASQLLRNGQGPDQEPAANSQNDKKEGPGWGRSNPCRVVRRHCFLFHTDRRCRSFAHRRPRF